MAWEEEINALLETYRNHYVFDESAGIVELGFSRDFVVNLSEDEVSSGHIYKGYEPYLYPGLFFTQGGTLLERTFKNGVYYALSPTRWRILKRDGNKALAISEKALEATSFNKDGFNLYNKDSIRKRLEEDFLGQLFLEGNPRLLPFEDLDGALIALPSVDDIKECENRDVLLCKATDYALRGDKKMKAYWTRDASNKAPMTETRSWDAGEHDQDEWGVQEWSEEERIRFVYAVNAQDGSLVEMPANDFNVGIRPCLWVLLG